jgi:hypothetical protein
MSWTDKLKAKATSAAKSYAEKKVDSLKSSLNQKLSDKLASLGDKIKSAVGSESLANAKLTDTTFFTKPTDELLTPDIYGLKDSNILSSVTSKLGAEVGNALEAFKSGAASSLSGALKNVLTISNGKVSLNTDSLKTRVMDALGGKSGLMNTLTKSAQNALTSSVTGVLTSAKNELADKVSVVVNGFATSLKTEDIASARGLCNMVNAITQDSKLTQFFDVESEATLLAGVMRNAIDLQIPNVVETLFDRSKSSEAAAYALRSNVDVALQYGDASTIAMMIDKLGAEQVLGDNPDAAKSLLTFYTIPTGVTTASYGALSDNLRGLLDTLSPNWNTVERNGETISNLSTLSVMTDDARRVLSVHDDVGLSCMIASSYADETDVLSSLKSDFGYALIPTA